MPTPFSVGLNCALGAKEMRSHMAEISRIADTLTCAYPNAGLPNEFGLYDESPEYMAGMLGGIRRRRSRQRGRRLLRHHARAYARDRARRSRAKTPRKPAEVKPMLRLSGLEPFTLTPEIPFVNVGERTNVTGSAKFRKLITAGRFSRRARGRARPGRKRRADHRRQHGRRPAQFAGRDDHLPAISSPPSPTSRACR